MELVFALVTLFFVYFLMVRINSDRVRKVPFMRIPAAHRGLYSKDQTVPENSLAAFRLAVQNGYAIELDVQASKDREVFVFHDNTLERMCGRPEHFMELDAETLRQIKLGPTNEAIPTFHWMSRQARIGKCSSSTTTLLSGCAVVLSTSWSWMRKHCVR